MILLLLILYLVAAGVACLAAERLSGTAPRWLALFTLALASAFVLGLAAAIPDAARSSYVLSDPDSWLVYWRSPWLPGLGVSLEFGLDGVSALLLVLSLLLGLVAISASWHDVGDRPGLFHANLLFSLAGVVGVFTALDLVLFFVFWEVMLVPMYLLIAIWGHERRRYGAMKFFIFTQASGLLLLVALIVLAHQAAGDGVLSFSYFDLLGKALDPQLSLWLMLGFFIAFVVKLPAFPVHSWLPDAHTQAPTAGSVLLAGILLKTGAYGLLRFCLPLFPDASRAIAPLALAIAVAGILYGGVLALGQRDFKRLVAYSSISHMGFVILGLYVFQFAAAQGAMMQMLAHGVSSSALFMVAGALQHRLHTRELTRMGGLWVSAPRLGAAALCFALAALGMPGLGNFIAEFLVLLGVFERSPMVAALAAVGMITAAIYALWLIQQSFHGEPGESGAITDADGRESLTLLLMLVALLWLGLYPQPVFELAEPVLRAVIATSPGSSA